VPRLAPSPPVPLQLFLIHRDPATDRQSHGEDPPAPHQTTPSRLRAHPRRASTRSAIGEQQTSEMIPVRSGHRTPERIDTMIHSGTEVLHNGDLHAAAEHTPRSSPYGALPLCDPGKLQPNRYAGDANA